MELKDTATIIGLVKDVILAGAALVTACVAARGVNSWLRELRGRTEFEAALALMRAAYRLREALFDCRAPLIPAAEFPEGSKLREGEKADSDERWRAYAHVLRERMSGVSTSMTEYDARALEAEAIWGKTAREATEPLRNDVGTLYAAIGSYLDDIAQEGEIFKADREFGKQVRSQVFASRIASNNELSNSIRSNIQRLEAVFGPHLKRR